MNVLILGATGQLGRLMSEGGPENTRLYSLARTELDITDQDSVIEAVERTKPDWIVNAAAYTLVDQAELEPDNAFKVNANALSHLALAAKRLGAKVLHVSTDYVFNACSAIPLKAGDATDPINVYGRSKRRGELVILNDLGSDALVVRTSWVYCEYGNNFVKTMLELMRRGVPIRVVDDQIGVPTWAGSLKPILWSLIGQNASGVYHWRDAGIATWYDFAIAISRLGHELDLLKSVPEIIPVPSAEYPTKARRPHYSVLDIAETEKTLGVRAQHWSISLRAMLSRLKEAGINE